MSRKLFTLLLLLAIVTGTVNAQRGKRTIKRIDREVQEAVFIPKGTWMAGGAVSYSEHDESNLNFLVIKDLEGNGYNFAISPYVGYFFRDNISAGVRFAYRRNYLDLGNVDANLGDITISFKDLYYLEHKYETSGFLRTYIPIGKSKIFGLFNEARVTYGYGTGKNSTGSEGTEPTDWFRPRTGCLYHRLERRGGVGRCDGFRFQVDRSDNQPSGAGFEPYIVR